MRKLYVLICALVSFLSAQSQNPTKIIINSPGSDIWVVPCGVTQITVEVWGAGGGGGGAFRSNKNAGGGGGGGGAYKKSTISVSGGQVFNYSIGAGGQGGGFFLWFSSDGDAGGSTTFGSLSANGGSGGKNGSNGGGTGGNRGNGTPGGYNGGDGGSGSGSFGAGGGGGAGSGGAGGNGNAGGGAGGNGVNPGGKGGDGQSNNGSGRNGETPGGGGGGARRSSAGSNDGGRGGDGQIIITYILSSSLTVNYCTPSSSKTEPITLVQFAGINNSSSSSTNSPSYELFCNEASVELGQTYPITLKGNTDGNYINYFTVFIDWNQDGDFDDAGESYNIGEIKNSTGLDATSLTGNISVPSNAKLGLTKMRIRKNYGSYLSNACGNNTYGQTEDYSLMVIGSCKQPTGATANNQTSITICKGTEVTLRQTGGQLGQGQTWKWYVNSPTGLNVNTNSNPDGALNVTPNATTTYYVRAEGGNCNTNGTGKTVTVTVVEPPAISLSAGSLNQTVCSGASLSPVSFTISGGATGATITWSPSTPAGINLVRSGNVFTISGSVSAAQSSGDFTYTITTVRSGVNPCVDHPTITGTITINNAPKNLNYGATNFVFCSGGPITPLNPSLTGTEPLSYTVSPALPTGLSIDANTGVISGTPTTVQSSLSYVVRATNTCGYFERTINISVSSGDQAFNITPVGTFDLCSDATGVPIGLNGSIIGVSYRLYRNGTPVGNLVNGTGNAITFGTYNQAGTYIVKTNSACATNMNGSVVVNLTQKPTTTFTYPTYTYCQSGFSPAALMSGSPLIGGVFSASPAGLVFDDAETGVINLGESEAGTYTLFYTVNVGGGCSSYTFTQSNHITIAPAADVYSVIGGGDYCQGSNGVEIGLERTQSGIVYQLLRNGVLVSPVQQLTGNGSEQFFPNRQTIEGTYSVQAILGSCTQLMDGEVEVSINPLPPNIKIVPGSETICQGSVQALTAALSTENITPTTVSATSTHNDITIPNNNATGISSVLRLTGIPANATITGISVNLRIDHSYDADLVINLKGPNGKVLNLVNQIGGSGDNFGSGTGSNINYTRIDNKSTNSIATGTAPFTAGNPYAPQAAGGIAGATIISENRSNVSTFESLFGHNSESANGTWVLTVRDNENRGRGTSNTGSLKKWQIVITYTTVSTPIQVMWSPATDLFTDPEAKIPYQTGKAASVVYVKPSSSGVKNYTATSMNNSGCTVSASSTLTVNPSPQLELLANYCTIPGKVRITGTTTQNSNWIWSTGQTTNNSTASFIDVDLAGKYYVSAQSIGFSCAATDVMSIAQELVKNGDFEKGNSDFESGYFYQADDPNRNNELYDDKNPVNNGYGVGTNGQNYHTNFWGVDHTYANGDGNFMIVNGHGDIVVWKNLDVTVLPNTTYYFSAFGMSLNDVNPTAKLKFVIEGDGVYLDNFEAKLDRGVNNNSNNGWKKFYGKWTSGPSTTSVNIYIVNLEKSLDGNDFGLDDISFATLSTFFNLTSDPGTNNQTALCADAPITQISYEVGGDGNPPILSAGSIPDGLQTYWNGRDYRIFGTPTRPGNYYFKLTSSGCNPQEQEVRLTVAEPTSLGIIESTSLVADCYGSNGSIPVTGSVGTLTWESSVDGVNNWSPVSNGSYNNLQAPKYFRVSAQNTSACQTLVSKPILLTVKNLWTGKTNTNWDMDLNWSDGHVPSVSGCPSVVIDEVKPVYNNRYPILRIDETVEVNNVIVKPNASITLGNNSKFKIAGAVTSSGSIDARTGILEFNGTSTQTISSSMFKDTTIRNLVVSNGSANGLVVNSSGSSLAITDKISFGSATGKLNSGDNITLKSTKEKTASLGVVGQNNAITGKFTVERYINSGTGNGEHGKKWLYIATPTGHDGNGQSIRQSWMEGGNNASTGFGINLTGPEGTAVGWDASSPSPAIKEYDDTKNLWKRASSANVDLYNPKGWMVFVRGDRSVSGVNAVANSTNLRSKGSLRTGKVEYNVPGDNTNTLFYSIGNPYASAIDMKKILTGSTESFTVWDPYAQGEFGLGAYQTYTKVDGEFIRVPVEEGKTNNYILSGQAFFIQQFPHSRKITIDESSKGETSDNTTYFRAMGTESGSLQMLKTNIYSSGQLEDGTLHIFGRDYSKAVDKDDARKMLNSGVNLSIKVDDLLLVVERKSPIVSSDTIFFNLTGTVNGKYRFAFDALNLSAPGLDAWLEDSFTGEKHFVSLDGTTQVDFDVTSDKNSKVANRFKIVFQGQKALPVTIVKLTAVKDGSQVVIRWNVAQEINVKKYVVMVSNDGLNFRDLMSIDAKDVTEYSAVDKNPIEGYNCYRVRSVDVDGRETYSEIAKVFIGMNEPSLRVFPNPVTDGHLNLRLENYPAGKYQVRLLNIGGQVMLVKSFDHNGGNYTARIPWDYKIAHGNYNLEVRHPDGSTKVIVVMY